MLYKGLDQGTNCNTVALEERMVLVLYLLSQGLRCGRDSAILSPGGTCDTA